jgi:hypothetical protein
MFRHAPTTVPRLSGAFEPAVITQTITHTTAAIAPTEGSSAMIRPPSDHLDQALACSRPLSGVPGRMLGFIRPVSGVPRRILGFIRPVSGILGFVQPLSDQYDEILDPFDTLFVIQPSGVLITQTTPSAPLRGAVWAVPSGCLGYQSSSPSSLEETSMKPRTVRVIPPRASMEPRTIRVIPGHTHPVDAVEPLRVASGIPSRLEPRRTVAAPPASRTRYRDHPALRYGQVGAVQCAPRAPCPGGRMRPARALQGGATGIRPSQLRALKNLRPALHELQVIDGWSVCWKGGGHEDGLGNR